MCLSSIVKQLKFKFFHEENRLVNGISFSSETIQVMEFWKNAGYTFGPAFFNKHQF